MKKIFKLSCNVVIVFFILSGLAFAVPGEKITFYHNDPAGSPIAMSEQGNIVWRANYKPFGEEHTITGSVENNKEFVGKEMDMETGFYYFGARYMLPEVGRFLSPDPVGPVDPFTSKTNYGMLTNPQRLNSYAYSLNNPHRYIDPDGRTVWDIADIGFFAHSAYKFSKEPTWSNAGNLALDTVGLLPLVPSLGMIKRVGEGIDKAIDASKAARWGRAETLARHFEKHGADFGAKSADEYANMASDFLVRAQKEKLPTKIAPDGTIRVYEPSSNTFGSYNPDGTTATFFKPSQGPAYWNRQKGTAPWTP